MMDSKPDIYGELPNRKDVLFAACDSIYFERFGFAFIESANLFNHHVHIHIVNPTKEILSSCCFINSLVDTNKVLSLFVGTTFL